MIDDIEWRSVGSIENIPRRGARRLCFAVAGRPVAIFRTSDDQVFALIDECPHRGGPLSEGIISGATVACPLHNWVIRLTDGVAASPDKGSTPCVPTRVADGEVFVGVTAGAASRRLVPGEVG
jgi:nitrite reductase (NADH) small subunit